MTIKDIVNKYPFLNRMYIKDVVLTGRDLELQMLEESLVKKRFKNALLIGKAGCGKTSLVEKFASLHLNDFAILELSLSGCLAGTRYRGDFEEKLTNCLENVIAYNNSNKTFQIILFIDEIHTIIKAGDSEGAMSAANILKPYLSKLEVVIIGATTIEEYNLTIKNDKALNRRFSTIFIKTLNKEVIINILNEFAGGKLGVALLEYIYDKSCELKNYTNPDISIEILDRCLARKKITGKTITRKMIDEIIEYMNIEVENE